MLRSFSSFRNSARIASPLAKENTCILTQKRTLYRPQKNRFNDEKLDCLYPFMSEKCFEQHYYDVYINSFKKLNTLVQGTPYLDHSELIRPVKIAASHLGDIEIFNAAAHLRNHEIFFDTLVPWDFSNADKELGKNTRRELYVNFGGLDCMKDMVLKKALEMRGSGWLWLINRSSHLEVMITHNNATPEGLDEGVIPLFCLDLWEHAYVDDYGADVEAYVDAFWHVLNWQKVEDRALFARRTFLFMTDRPDLE